MQKLGLTPATAKAKYPTPEIGLVSNACLLPGGARILRWLLLDDGDGNPGNHAAAGSTLLHHRVHLSRVQLQVDGRGGPVA